MEWYYMLALAGIGLVTGFINMMAGGGSALTLPMLIFLGLPANVANGTNRIGILMQSIVGVKAFHKKNILDFSTDSRLVIPAILGSIAGTLLAVEINEALLEKIIAVLMVVMLLMVIFNPETWLRKKVAPTTGKPTIFQYIIFVLIGFYGGFIQMGVGFFLLAGLVMGCRYDLIKANAIKVFITLVFTVFSIGIFIVNKQVDIFAGIVLAVGNMAGAWLGAHFMIKNGAIYIRYALILAMILVILNLFGVFG